MHAWLCENPVGVDALTWKELPTPAPKAGEVLIRIHAASLNFPDLLIVQNKYQMKPALPFVPGSEYAGVVEAVGDGVLGEESSAEFGECWYLLGSGGGRGLVAVHDQPALSLLRPLEGCGAAGGTRDLAALADLAAVEELDVDVGLPGRGACLAVDSLADLDAHGVLRERGSVGSRSHVSIRSRRK